MFLGTDYCALKIVCSTHKGYCFFHHTVFQQLLLLQVLLLALLLVLLLVLQLVLLLPLLVVVVVVATTTTTTYITTHIAFIIIGLCNYPAPMGKSTNKSMHCFISLNYLICPFRVILPTSGVIIP